MSQISDASPEPKPSPEKPVAKPADGKAPEAGRSKKSKKPKKPVRWRRRLIIAGVLVLAIGFLIRIAVALLLPTTLRQVAKSYGLDITYERSDMYLFNGDVGLWHVRVTPAGGGEPILQAEYCRGDVSPLQLLRGRLVAERIEADGVELVVRRNADGTIPLLQTLLAGQKPQATPAGSATKAPPQAVDLSPPVAIDALRLTHVRAHLNDRSVSPALQTDVDLNIGLWDLASPVRPTRFTMDVFADALLDSFQVEGQGTSDGKVLDATFRASARGLHPAPLAGYLAPLGLRPRAGEIAMRMNGSIKTTVATGNPNAIQAVLKVENVAVTADGQDALTLKSLTVKADSIASGSIALAAVVMEDGACNAQRTESGAVRLAGIEWSPDSARATRAAPPPAPVLAAAASTPPVVAPAAAATPPLRWTLGELAFRKLQATLADRSVSPATNLAFIVDDVSLKGFVCDPDKPDAPVAIAGRFLAPGLLREVNLSGTAHPFATNMTADLVLKAQGVRPDAVRPYFAAMGIESTLHDGNFSCRLSAGLAAPGPGRLAINARLQQLLWEDGRQLLTLDDVKIAGVGLDGQTGSVRVDAIDVSGPKLSVRHESSGAIAAGGLRFLPRDKSKSAAANSSPKSPVVVKVAGRKTLAEPDLLRSLPKIDIGRFTWNAVRIQFDDDSVSPSTVVAIEDAGIAMENLHIDFDPKAAAPAPGHIRAWLKAPGVAGTLSLDGVVTPRPGGLLADLEVSGEKLSTILTGPYLKSLGVEPTLVDAALHARTHVDIAQDGEVLKASVALRDFTLTDGGEELLGLESAAISGIELKPGVLEIADVELVHPRGRLARDEDYALRVAGFRLLPKPPEQKKSAFAAASGMGPMKTPAASDANVNGGLASQTAALPMALVLRKLTIRDAAVGWTDRAVLPIAQTSATVNGSVEGVTWGKPAGPAKLSFTAKVNGIADTLSVSGTAAVGADSADVALDLSASGIRQGALASYLPPGMQIELKDGRFAGHLAASVVPNAMGGMGVKVTFSGIDFRDGTDGAPLFRLAEARVALTRLDMPGAIALDEISTTGAEMSASKTPDGTLHALGIAMAASPPESKATAPTVAPAVARAGPSRPTVVPAMVAPRALAVTPGSAALATASPLTLVVAKLKYPLVTVRKLDLNLSRFSFTDESRPESAPLEVTDLRLFARKPIEMLGDDPASLAPAELELDCRVDHVVDSVRLTMQVAPFAGQPSMQMDIAGAGVHGDGLLALLPELKPQIDGHGLTDGRFRAHLETQLQIDRIDPLDFGLVRGFDADFVMKGLEYRSEENGPVLAGLEEVRSEGIRVKPATGNVVVKSLEVTKPIGVAVREKDGVHVAGLVFKVPEANQPAATQPAIVKSSAPAGQVAGATGNTELTGNNRTTPPLPPTGTDEIRISKLLVSG
ncbi:MAG: hypothetical protein JWP03_5308, partial [Phycisphaerales bacterium]|nr:hypothetical protein [Phycisphaerales bacterium]